MNKTSTAAVSVKQRTAQYETQIDRDLLAIKNLQQEMTNDREEILRLQSETRAILDDVMTTLKAA